MGIRKSFSLGALFSMDKNVEDETSTVEQEVPVWSEDVIEKPSEDAFSRLPKGDKQEDF